MHFFSFALLFLCVVLGSTKESSIAMLTSSNDTAPFVLNTLDIILISVSGGLLVCLILAVILLLVFVVLYCATSPNFCPNRSRKGYSKIDEESEGKERTKLIETTRLLKERTTELKKAKTDLEILRSEIAYLKKTLEGVETENASLVRKSVDLSAVVEKHKRMSRVIVKEGEGEKPKEEDK